MELTRENMADWKRELDKLAEDIIGRQNFSKCLSDEEWLLYMGMTPMEVLYVHYQIQILLP